MSFSQFQKQALEAHNNYRQNHKVPPLVLNEDLCNYAQEWANVIAAKSVMQHRSNSKFGENIYYFYSSDPHHEVRGKDSVDCWYDEIKKHTFNREPTSMDTGHFTQIVWKDCKELGVGVCKNSQGQVFVVANYDPPGNYIGKYTVSVPPVGGF